MKYSKALVGFLLLGTITTQCFAQEVNVCAKVRGTTGIESQVQKMIVAKINALKKVTAVDEKQNAHVYIDATLVEQKQLQFYALGFCIAYHLNGKFYSRPTSDVAQFGKERIAEVCEFIVKQIDKAFCEPLKKTT
ncbi:MAG: hypothetical protein ABIH85_02675 [Candidatus Omnitrophota bacterium]